MSRKYVAQINNQNFVFPNKDLAEYDIELVQDLNENSVSGTVTNFLSPAVASSGMTFTFDYEWVRNGAEVFVLDEGLTSVLSVHMMTPDKLYYKPWRLIFNETSTFANVDNITGGVTISVTPAQMGLSTFISGIYYFEIRFIGHRAIYPVCEQKTITI